MYILWYFNCGSDFRDEKWLYGNDYDYDDADVDNDSVDYGKDNM